MAPTARAKAKLAPTAIHTGPIRVAGHGTASRTTRQIASMVKNVAMSELGLAKVIPNRTHLIMPWIERMVRVVRGDDGKYATEIINQTTGEVRISPKSGSMSPMSIAELVEEMKDSEDYGVCFESDGASGSGASGAGGKGGTLTATRDEMRDPDFYEAMTKRAAEAGKKITDVVIKE